MISQIRKKMEKSKIVLTLSLDEVLRVDEIVNKVGSDSSFNSVVKEFEFFLSKHYYQFGCRPFSIEYLPSKGYVIRASSLIGKVATDNFEINLNPKFKDLPFGKCLAMAQYSGSSLLNISSNNLTKTLISNKYEYSTEDYLAFGLIDSVTTIINNGLVRTFREIITESVKIRGAISITDTVKNGRTLINPFVIDSGVEHDILPNKIIKTALQKIISNSKNVQIKNAVNALLTHFIEIGVIETMKGFADHFNHFFNLPRHDYEKALLYSISIIEGGYIGIEGEGIQLPSITLDLDQVFEKYISIQLQNLLGKDRFDISLQKEIDHVSTPALISKKLIPDIVIQDNKTSTTFVIDTKNKYTELAATGIINLSNGDIFQAIYYCQTLNAQTAILLYPSTKPKFQFPIRASESETAFKTKCKNAFEKLVATQQYTLFKSNKIRLIIYHIDLSGSLYDSEKSVASLCQLLVYLSENEKKN